MFDYTKHEGFYIDPMRKWQITMNLANTPTDFLEDQEYIDYYQAISMHEVSHYMVIPYDGLTNARLLKAALKHVNQNLAPIVVNVFSDLIIDYKLHQEHPELMEWELGKTHKHLKELYGENICEFTQFLFGAYQYMWKTTISKEEPSPKLKALSKQVSNIILKDFEDESKWEKKSEDVAKYLKNIINDTFTFCGYGVSPEKGKECKEGPGGRTFIEVPEDVLDVMGNPLENRNSDKLEEGNDDKLRQKSEEFASNCSYPEFGAPASQAGILIDGNPLATWYRGKAKNLIEIQIFEEKPGGELPAYPEVWRVGDPLEELDIVQTLLNSPKIIPNITTRKWKYKLGPGRLQEKQIPDLLLVIDSSGSMDWNYVDSKRKGAYHTALVASFAALHHAASKGAKFSVINFSGFPDICDWTTNYHQAESVLLRYQGNGTELPVKAIQAQCNKADGKALVFIITDFGIYNWDKSKKTMIDLVNRGHKLVGFFIGASTIPKDVFQELIDKVTFYPIKNVKDLVNLVISEVKKYYE